MTKVLWTTLGPMTADELGMILPHEHVFVDLRTPDQPGYAQADPDDVVRLMAPEIEKAQALGVTALVECTTGGVGRRADIDLAVSQATGLPIVVPTGNYREPWIPDWVRDASEAALEAWMVRELEERFDEADFRAAWIKISAGDDGITPLEERILRAAARAGQRTGAIIGSHTIRGRVVMDQLDIIEAEGYRADRFISIHTQNETADRKGAGRRSREPTAAEPRPGLVRSGPAGRRSATAIHASLRSDAAQAPHRRGGRGDNQATDARQSVCGLCAMTRE